MKGIVRVAGGGVLFIVGLALVGVPMGLAQEAVGVARIEVVQPVAFDVSPPLRDIKPIPPKFEAKHEKPLGYLPPAASSQIGGEDAAMQYVYGPLVSVNFGFGFQGLGVGGGYTPNAAPPDTNGSVGATQYVQWVNEAFAVYNKSTGALQYGPAAGNTLWSGFGGGCQTNNDGDPIALYDKAAGRWLMTQFSVSTTPYLQCIAISATSDATGSWYRYAYQFSQFNDYPKFGVWPDAYYASFNMFTSSFQGAKACAFNRSAMLTGSNAASVCFQLSTSYGGLLPSDLDGSNAPPSGSPDYFVNFGSNKLNVWKFHVDWTNTANSTFTGPTAISVASFTPACGSGGTCIPQPSTRQQLDSLGDRLMYRLAYRHFTSDGHESLVVNHAIQIGTKRSSYTAERWYELRITNQTPSLYQQGTFAPDSNHRWMGSLAMDKVGNIGFGFSKSSSTVKPAIWLTGRNAGDALGTMQAETQLQVGGGSQLTNLSRWGDYSSLSIDPSDDCTMWYTNEYLKANGTFNWSTWVSNFKFPSCQ